MKLLPCPCCGSSDIYAGLAHAFGYHVKCNGCGLRTRDVNLPSFCGKKNLPQRLTFAAMEAWNLRQPSLHNVRPLATPPLTPQDDAKSPPEPETVAKQESGGGCQQEPCSRSLDLFKDWEQYCRVKITGYTFRNGTDVMRINFGPSGPSPLSRQAMVDHVRLGFGITAIHYSENVKSADAGAVEGRLK